MPSYYNRVKGDLEEGKLAKSSDIQLIQSGIQNAISRMIIDLYGQAFILGYDEDILTLSATPVHVDQKNTDFTPTPTKKVISFHGRYLRQSIFTEKSEITKIKVLLSNDSDVPVTVQAEIRDTDFNLKGEASYFLQTRAKRKDQDFDEAVFNFNLTHLPVGHYYFVIRPIDLSEVDLKDYTILNYIKPEMFCAKMDAKGSYAEGLQVSNDGSYYVNANILNEFITVGSNYEIQEIDKNNYDLYFEQVFSTGNTYIIEPGPAIINGEKVYPLDTHVSINGPSNLGDRTDLVYMTADGKVNVKEGKIYNKSTKSDDNYPTIDNALKIAYITTYKNSAEQWVCPNCGHTNVGNISTCTDCGYAYIQNVPLIEQDDDNFVTRNRDVLERIRRLEKKMTYTMDRNSPSRIKYICTIDPIVKNDDKSDTEGTHNIVATQNADGETIYVPQTGYNVKQLYWSIREQTGLQATPISKTIKGTITGYNITKVFGTQTPYVVNLKDPDTMDPKPNEAIDITINGVKYTRTTNQNGDASLNINLPAGTYTAVVSYGDAIIENSVVVLAEGSTLPEDAPTSKSATNKTTRVSTTGVVIDGKVISNNVRTGDDSFYKDGVIVDTIKGTIELSKTEYGNINSEKEKEKSKKNEYVKTTSLENLKGATYAKQTSYVMKKNDTNAYNSEYPVLNFNIEHDCSVKTITPNLKLFKNLESFAMIIFKNDVVFNQKEGMRYAYRKRFKDDPSFPNVFESDLISLKEARQDGEYRILDTPHTFDVTTDGQNLTLEAGQYSVLIYGNIEEGKEEGEILINEYAVNDATKNNNCGEGVRCLGTVHPTILYLENSGVTGNTWDCIFEKKNDSYFDRGIIISQGIGMSGHIKTCSASTNMEIPDGCSITTYVSNNGGKTWVNASSGPITFAGTGNVFKWKYILEGNGTVSPKIKFNEDKMWAMVFNIGIASSIVQYEDYNSCFETQLIDAENTTSFLLQQPVSKHFSEWEFARIWMEDPDRKSTIDILTSYDDTSMHLGMEKQYWPSTLFFNTIFADLKLADFQQTSVDYDNYSDEPEYDENNYRFDFDENYTYNLNVGEIIARGKDAGDINNGGLDYITYKYQTTDVSYLYSQAGSTVGYNILKKEDSKITPDIKKEIIKMNVDYTEANYSPESTAELWYAATGENADIQNFNYKDIIIGVPFSFGFNISSNHSSIGIDLFANLQIKDADKLDPNIPKKYYTDETLTVEITSNKDLVGQDVDPYVVRYIPAGTMEVVIAFNQHGQIEDDNSTYGKAYTINQDIISSQYNHIDIDITDEVYAYESVRSIGIRFKNDAKAKETLRSVGELQDSIGIGTIRLYGYNIRPLIPYDVDSQIKWTPVYTTDLFNGGITKNSASNVYKEICYNEQYVAKGEGWNFYNQVPLPSYNTARKQKKTDFNNLGTPYVKHGTLNYYGYVTNNYHNNPKDIINTTNEIVTWKYNNKNVQNKMSWGDVVFDINSESGNLFKIPVDTPLSAYKTILISYYVHTSVVEEKDTSASSNSNVHYNEVTNETYTCLGSFDKGEFYIDLYEDEQLDRHSEPIESFALPAWGRVCAQSDVYDKTITAFFKKRSSAKRVKWIVLRRENPKKKTLRPIRLYLRNIVAYTSEKHTSMGPKLMMRIYPNSLNATNIPKFRKYGVVYKLT